MPNNIDLIITRYSTTEASQTKLNAIKEIFNNYFISVIDYYETNELELDTYYKNLFKVELNNYLIGLTPNCKKYVKKILHLTCEYYFENNLEALLDNGCTFDKLCFPTEDFLLSKGNPSYFLFSDISVTLSAEIDFSNISILKFNMVKDNLELHVVTNH